MSHDHCSLTSWILLCFYVCLIGSLFGCILFLILICLQVLDLANNARLTGRLEAAPQVKATDDGSGAPAAFNSSLKKFQKGHARANRHILRSGHDFDVRATFAFAFVSQILT